LPTGKEPPRVSYSWFEPTYKYGRKKWIGRESGDLSVIGLALDAFGGHEAVAKRTRVVAGMMRLFAHELSVAFDEPALPIRVDEIKSVADVLYKTATAQISGKVVLRDLHPARARVLNPASDRERCIDFRLLVGREGSDLVFRNRERVVESVKPNGGKWPRLNDESFGPFVPLVWGDDLLASQIAVRVRHFRSWVARLCLAAAFVPGSLDLTERAISRRARADGAAPLLYAVLNRIAVVTQRQMWWRRLRSGHLLHHSPAIRFIDPFPWLRWSDDGRDYAEIVERQRREETTPSVPWPRRASN
jgi:hypothetical protein